jgi:cytolysin (calcineurin-like family phosphatase)
MLISSGSMNTSGMFTRIDLSGTDDRRIPVDLTVLVTSLLGACNAETCPQMKADEWQYLCTAHGNEGAEECSAIDYILHT